MITGPIRHGPIDHIIKSGTPTMGGVIIIIGIISGTLLWADLKMYMFGPWFCFYPLGSLGLLDDILKLNLKTLGGLNQVISFLAK